MLVSIGATWGMRNSLLGLNPSSHGVDQVDDRLWGPSGASLDPARGFPGRQNRPTPAPGHVEAIPG